MYTCKHTYIQANTLARSHACTQIHTHTHSHTHAHWTHTCMHMNTHVHNAPTHSCRYTHSSIHTLKAQRASPSTLPPSTGSGAPPPWAPAPPSPAGIFGKRAAVVKLGRNGTRSGERAAQMDAGEVMNLPGEKKSFTFIDRIKLMRFLTGPRGRLYIA